MTPSASRGTRMKHHSSQGVASREAPVHQRGSELKVVPASLHPNSERPERGAGAGDEARTRDPYLGKVGITKTARLNSRRGSAAFAGTSFDMNPVWPTGAVGDTKGVHEDRRDPTKVLSLPLSGRVRRDGVAQPVGNAEIRLSRSPVRGGGALRGARGVMRCRACRRPSGDAIRRCGR